MRHIEFMNISSNVSKKIKGLWYYILARLYLYKVILHYFQITLHVIIMKIINHYFLYIENDKTCINWFFKCNFNWLSSIKTIFKTIFKIHFKYKTCRWIFRNIKKINHLKIFHPFKIPTLSMNNNISGSVNNSSSILVNFNIASKATPGGSKLYVFKQWCLKFSKYQIKV